MSTFRVEWSEKKTTKTGKEMIKATLKDAEGKVYEDVAIWSNFPDFNSIQSGGEVTGTLDTKVNGQYTNITLNGEGLQKKSPAFSKNMEKTMEKKAEYIREAQGSKETGIKLASTLGKAVDIAIAMKSDTWDVKTMQDEITFWRKWLWENWGKDESDITQPF